MRDDQTYIYDIALTGDISDPMRGRRGRMLYAIFDDDKEGYQAAVKFQVENMHRGAAQIMRRIWNKSVLDGSRILDFRATGKETLTVQNEAESE